MKKAAFLLFLPVVSLLSCLHGGSSLKAPESAAFRGIVLHDTWEDTSRYTRFFKAVTENHPELAFDIEFLDRVFSDAEKVQPLLERHPEYTDLVTKLVSLYKEITDKALENESKA